MRPSRRCKHRAIRCSATPTTLCWLATALVAFPCNAEERYFASNPSGIATITIIGVVDESTFTVTDLDQDEVVEIGLIDRLQVAEVDATDLFHFEIRSSEPLMAYLGYDCCGLGGSTFVPTEDGHAMVGRAFLLYLPIYGIHSDLFVFAIEDANVIITEPEGATIAARTIQRGDDWLAYPIVGARPYIVRSTGDIALMLSTSNGLTTVPPARRSDSCDNDVGRLFYLATHSWGSGALAVFAYEQSDVAIFPLLGEESLADVALESGTWLFMHELWRKSYRVEATGEVAVWAGDLQGGSLIEDMGDDFSYNLGRDGLEIIVHGQSQGATVFAPYDDTTLTLNGEELHLDGGRWLELEPSMASRLTSDRPVVAMTYGGNNLDDWGGYLRPAPPLSPRECPDQDADIPSLPDAGDEERDSDLHEDEDAGWEAGVFWDADAQGSDNEDGGTISSPRSSCDCTVPGANQATSGAQRMFLLK